MVHVPISEYEGCHVSWSWIWPVWNWEKVNFRTLNLCEGNASSPDFWKREFKDLVRGKWDTSGLQKRWISKSIPPEMGHVWLSTKIEFTRQFGRKYWYVCKSEKVNFHMCWEWTLDMSGIQKGWISRTWVTSRLQKQWISIPVVSEIGKVRNSEMVKFPICEGQWVMSRFQKGRITTPVEAEIGHVRISENVNSQICVWKMGHVPTIKE